MVVLSIFEPSIRKKIFHFFLSFLLIWQTLSPSLSFATNCLFDDEISISIKGRKDFTEWQYVKHIEGDGGGTGVHIYQDPKTQQKFTIKTATHQNHLIEEITAKALYQTLEFNASPFAVLDRKSQSWPKAWDQTFPDTPRVLISSFIEAGPADKGEKKKIMRWVDVLLGNFDLAGHNYIIDANEEIWPIDFGGSLRLRASGTPKEHADLWGYFWPKHATIVSPTAEELNQFKTLLPKFFETLIDLHHELSIPDFPSLWNILTSRVHSFLMTYDPNTAPEFYGDRPALEEQVAGGVLFVTEMNGISHALVAKRSDGWGDLGGDAKFQDRTLNRSAWREAVEEMGGFIPLDYSTLISSPYIESFGDVLYRMFLVKVPSIDVQGLKQHVKSPNNPYLVEHDDYMLLPLENLSTFQDLYAPMRALLSTVHAQAMIESFCAGHSMKLAKGGTCFTGCMNYGNFKFPILKLDLIPSCVFDARANVATELKSKLQEQPLIVKTTSPYTQTRGFMKAHLKDGYIEGDDEQNLTRLLLEKSSFFKGKPDEVAQKLPYILKILSPEVQYPGHAGFYHGGRGHFGILWIIASLLRNELFLTEDGDLKTLRLYENAFEGLNSLAEHFAEINKDKNHFFVDYAEGGQARILSTNLSLLGSLGRDSSETLEYFFSNTCNQANEEPLEILRHFLHVVLKLPAMATEQFMKEVTPLFISLDKTGALYQLFLPKKLAEHYTYLSHPGGKRALYQDQQKNVETINSPIKFIQALKETPQIVPDLVQDDFNIVQGRVFLHPEMLYGNKSKEIYTNLYFSDGRSVEGLKGTIQNAIVRLLKPHLHLALSHQAYTHPPRLIQLYNMISGTAKDETDPRLEALIELSEHADANITPTMEQVTTYWLLKQRFLLEIVNPIGDPMGYVKEFVKKCMVFYYQNNNDVILNQLEDINIAKLEKVDPLSLERVRAISLSPLLAPLAESIAEKLVTFTQALWTDFLEQVKHKFSRIITFVKDEKLDHPSQTIRSLAPLLNVGPEDCQFLNVREILQCSSTQKLLFQSNPEILQTLGGIGVQLYKWGAKRKLILQGLEDAGFIILDGQSINQSDLLCISSDADPQKIQDVLDMLIAEKFPFTRNIANGGNCSGVSTLINDIIEEGIEESRLNLKQIISDLDIQQNILFWDVKRLLETKTDLGARWNMVAQAFVRLLKPYNLTAHEWDQAFYLLDEEGEIKVEQILQLLETEGFLKSTTRFNNLGFLSFLYTLCKTKNPSHTISQIKSLSLEDQEFYDLSTLASEQGLKLVTKLQPILDKSGGSCQFSSILYEFEKLSDAEQDAAIEFLKTMPPQPGGYVANILRAWNEFPNRRNDIKQILPFILDGTGLVYGDQAIKWALAQDPTLLPQICFYFQLGLLSPTENSSTYCKTAFATLVKNYEYFKENFAILKPFINNSHAFPEHGDDIFSLIDQKKPSAENLKTIIGFVCQYAGRGHNQAISLFCKNYDAFEKHLEIVKPFLSDYWAVVRYCDDMFRVILEKDPSAEKLKTIIGLACKYSREEHRDAILLLLNNYDIFAKYIENFEPFLSNYSAFGYHAHEVFRIILEKNPTVDILKAIVKIACECDREASKERFSLIKEKYDAIEKYIIVLAPFISNHSGFLLHHDTIFKLIEEKKPSCELLEEVIKIACDYPSEENKKLFQLVIKNYNAVERNLAILKPFMNNREICYFYGVSDYNGDSVFKLIHDKNPSSEMLETIIAFTFKGIKQHRSLHFFRENFDVIEKNIELLKPYEAFWSLGDAVFRLMREKNPSSELLKTILAVSCKSKEGSYPFSQMIEILFDNELDINATNKHGYTPLTVAIRHGCEETVKILLSHENCNPNIKGSNGDTPLHMAVEHRSINMVKELLAKGANINALDKNGHKPLFLTRGEGLALKEIGDLLRQAHKNQMSLETEK